MKDKIWLLGCASAFALSVLAGLAHAQDDAGADEAELREDVIIVTAKARAQDLQDVALAISVFSEEELDLKGISNVQNLADFTPNLEISSPFGRRDAVLSVRGLGASTTDEKYQSVGFFVDGIWMGGQIVGMSTSDVERIEVIKGPHSTFGRATYGASIDYVTKTPSLDEFSASLRGQISSMETGVDTNHEITGTLEGPIVPGKVSGSLYAQQRFDSGIAPAFGGQSDPVGEEQTNTYSAVLYTEFTPRTSLKLRALYTEDEDTFINGFESRPQYWIQQGANVVQNAAGQAWISGEVPDPIRERYYSGDITANHIGGTAENMLEREKTFFSAIFDHEFENGFAVKYSGSFMQQEENALFDGIAPPGSAGGIDPVLGDVSGLNITLGGFNNVIKEEWEETSHTIRLLSPDDDVFTWSVGAHWYDSENVNFTPNEGFIALFTGFRGADNVSQVGLNRTEEIETQAIFGDISYQINDQFRVELEGRYQEETVGRVATPNALFSSQRLGNDIERTESNFNPRLTLSYEPNEDHHLYALYAEGNKSGRFSFGGAATLEDGSSSIIPGSVAVRSGDAWAYVEPESLKNYELGWKSVMFDGRARSSVAVFYQDIQDQQFVSTVQSAVNPTGFITQLANVGGSEIFGWEADTSFDVTDDFNITAAIGYNDQEFQDDVAPQEGNNVYIFNLAGDPVGSETLKGKSFSNISKWSGNFSGTYSKPTTLLGADDWSIRGDLLYKGKKYVDNANLAYIPDNWRANLRASLNAENWTFSVFADNIFDDETAYRGNAFPCGISSVTDPAVASQLGLATPAPATDLAAGQRCLSLVPSRSREIGASIQVRF